MTTHATRTRQEIFDIAYRGIASQGFEKSYGDIDDTCRYRAANGLRCAIGWLIPDSKYNAGLEYLPATSIAVLKASNVSYKDASFVQDLQVVHDYAYYPEDMKARLEAFAKRHDLTIPEVE